MSQNNKISKETFVAAAMEKNKHLDLLIPGITGAIRNLMLAENYEQEINFLISTAKKQIKDAEYSILKSDLMWFELFLSNMDETLKPFTVAYLSNQHQLIKEENLIAMNHYFDSSEPGRFLKETFNEFIPEETHRDKIERTFTDRFNKLPFIMKGIYHEDHTVMNNFDSVLSVCGEVPNTKRILDELLDLTIELF